MIQGSRRVWKKVRDWRLILASLAFRFLEDPFNSSQTRKETYASSDPLFCSILKLKEMKALIQDHTTRMLPERGFLVIFLTSFHHFFNGKKF